jgi:hypothetical protein
MNGPLTCSECRHLLAYDKRLEEENLRYHKQREERRPRLRTQASPVPTLEEATGQNPPVATDGIEIPAPRSAFSFPRQYAFDNEMNPVIQTGGGTNNSTLVQTEQTREQEEQSQPYSPPHRQLMTHLHTKDRLQALFRSWKYHERNEDGRVKARLSFTIPLSPNPFTLLRDAVFASPDWDVPSSPWTHHLLQYQKTNLRPP